MTKRIPIGYLKVNPALNKVYTVLRFVSQDESVESLIDFGNSLNRVRDGTFTGIDRAGGRFSCSVSVDDNWVEHERRIEDLMIIFKQYFLEAQRLGIEAEFDVAIEAEDRLNKMYVTIDLDPELMKQLSDSRVAFVVTCYN